MRAKRVRRTKIFSKILVAIIFISIIFLIFIYLYTTYQKIEINNSNYEIEQVVSTKIEKTVEKEEEKSKNIADILEETMESVVGISKLKDNRNLIFYNDSEKTLGFGTGIIVKEDGYILSNEHVTR